MHSATTNGLYTRLTDEALIQSVYPEQPRQCLESLYNRYVGKVYHQCLLMTKNREKAQDFTQDIFIKVFYKLGAFQQRSSFSTWLYSVSYNYCADQLRLNKRLLFTSLSTTLEPEPAEMEKECEELEPENIVKRAMEKLVAEDQKLLRLKYEQGLRIDEIAQLYKINVSAVKMRLKRSRQKLQRLAGTDRFQKV